MRPRSAVPKRCRARGTPAPYLSTSLRSKTGMARRPRRPQSGNSPDSVRFFGAIYCYICSLRRYLSTRRRARLPPPAGDPADKGSPRIQTVAFCRTLDWDSPLGTAPDHSTNAGGPGRNNGRKSSCSPAACRRMRGSVWAEDPYAARSIGGIGHPPRVRAWIAIPRIVESRSRIFLLGAAGEQEENGLGASASGPARTLTQNVPLGSRIVSQKVNFLGQGNKGRLISSAVRRRTGEYPPARLLLPGGLEPRSASTRACWPACTWRRQKKSTS